MLAKENSDGFDSKSSSGAGETHLSADASFKGTIQFKSSLRLDGKFEGEIRSNGTLFVGKTGSVKADIKVGSIIVEGKIHGNIEAENKVDLRASAQLYGDIKATKLVISEGVSFVGNCNVNPNNENINRGDKKEIKPELAFDKTEAKVGK